MGLASIIKSGATGTGGSGTAAPASNVSGASVSVRYGLWGNASAYGFEGSFTLPTTAPGYHEPKFVHPVVTLPDGSTDELCPPVPAGTTVFQGAITYLQDGSAHSVTVRFLAENEDGVITPLPFSITVTVNASAVSSVVGREVPGTLTVDPVTRLVSTTVGGVVLFANSQVPQTASYLLSEDGGVTFVWIGWATVTLVGQEIQFQRVRPVSAQTWKIAMVAGAVGGDPSKRIPAAQLPAGAVVSAGFTVAGLAAPAGTLVSSLSLSAGAGGTFPFNRVDSASGYQDWCIESITCDLTAAAAGTDAAFATLVVRDLDGSGNPIGVKHKKGTIAIPQGGGVVQWGPIAGPYGSAAVPVRSGNIGQVLFELYLSSRKNQADDAWTDSTTSTLQCSVIKTVAVGGAIPAGATPPSAMLAPGSPAVDPITYEWVPTTQLDPGDTSEFDLLIPITAPAPLGTYEGIHVYLEVPDGSYDNNSWILGSTALGVARTAQAWRPHDYGRFPYSASVSIARVRVRNVDIRTATNIRVITVPFSAAFDPRPVRNGQTGATASYVVTVQPQSSPKPNSGANVTPYLVTGVSASVGAAVYVGGKKKTPISVTVDLSGLPDPLPDGWAYQLLGYTGGDITKSPVLASGYFRTGGLVGAEPDGIDVPHTFGPETPTVSTSITIFAVAGLMANSSQQSSAPVFIPNNVVPSITVGTPVTIGTGAGVIDLSASDPLTSFLLNSGLGGGAGTGLGVNTSSGLGVVGNALKTFLGGGVKFDLSNNIAVDLGAGLKLNLNTVTADLGSGLTASGNQIQLNLASGLKFTGAQVQADVGNGVKFTGNQIEMNLGSGMKFNAGAAQVDAANGFKFTGTQLDFNLGNGLNISGTALQVQTGNGLTAAAGSLTLNLGNGLTMSGSVATVKTNSNGIGFDGSGNIQVNAGSGLSIISLQVGIPTNGVTSAMIANLDVSKLNAGTLTVSNSTIGIKVGHVGDSRRTEIVPGLIAVTNGSGIQIAGLDSSFVDARGNGGRFILYDGAGFANLQLDGAGGISASTLNLLAMGFSGTGALNLGGILNFQGGSSGSAGAGAATLPSNPVGFINVKVSGTNYKIPYYN